MRNRAFTPSGWDAYGVCCIWTGLRTNRAKYRAKGDPVRDMDPETRKQWVRCPCGRGIPGIQDTVHFLQECGMTDMARAEANLEATRALESLGGADLLRWKGWPIHEQNRHLLSQEQKLTDKAERLARSAAAEVWVSHTKRISDGWIQDAQEGCEARCPIQDEAA